MQYSTPAVCWDGILSTAFNYRLISVRPNLTLPSQSLQNNEINFAASPLTVSANKACGITVLDAAFSINIS